MFKHPIERQGGMKIERTNIEQKMTDLHPNIPVITLSVKDGLIHQ